MPKPSLLLILIVIASAGELPRPHHLHELGRRDQIQNLHLSRSEFAAVERLTANPDCTQQDNLKLRAQRVDLSGRGQRELAVQASDLCRCGATGNCAFWLLERKPGGYKVLLDTYLVQTFSVEPGSTRGYKDVIVASSGAMMRDMRVFRYDGDKYAVSDCMTASNPSDANGNPTEKEIFECVPCVDHQFSLEEVDRHLNHLTWLSAASTRSRSQRYPVPS